MYTIHATRKLLDRVKEPIRPAVAEPSALLGNWYANAIFRRPPHVALVMNERTLLPVFMPLAPAGSMLERFPEQLALVLRALNVRQTMIAEEIELMGEGSYAKTAIRSLLGSMNDFARLAGYLRADGLVGDLVEFSARMAETPCGPLYKSYTSPNRAVLALFDEFGRCRKEAAGSRVPPSVILQARDADRT